MSTEPGPPAVPPFGEAARAGDGPSPAGDGGADAAGVTVEPDPAAVPRPVDPTPPDVEVPSVENPPGVEVAATDAVVALEEVGTGPEVVLVEAVVATDEGVPADEVTSPQATDAPDLDPATVQAPEPALDLDVVAADLDSVEAALARLDDGSYGRCAGCGDEIDDLTLAADPTAMACSAHLPAIAG